MASPEIINKDFEVILKEIEGKAPFYTPEWKFDDKDDYGVALSKIFSYLTEIVIKRLNCAPQKHFLGFLETVGASLLPPQQARVPLTFVPAGGASGNILVPELTQAAASGADGKPVLFETEVNTIVTPSKLVSVYSVIKDGDAIYNHTAAINGSGTTDLFMGDNTQEHILYIGDKKLLDLKKATLQVDIRGVDEKSMALLADKKYVAWEYGTEVAKKENGKEIKIVEWHPFTDAYVDTDKTKLLFLVKVNDEPISEIELPEISGIKSRWMRCKVQDLKIVHLAGIRIKNLTLSASPGIEQTVHVRSVQGIGDKFCKELLEKGIETADELLKLSPDGLSKMLLNCSRTRAVNILEAARKVFYDKTGLTEVSPVKGITPDMAFCNDVPVDLSLEVYPFGTKPQLYSTFFIASADAFSKEGYKVTITASLSAGTPSSSNAPKLSWEYWDGEGWVALDSITENWCGKIKSTAKCTGVSDPGSFEYRSTEILVMPRIEKTKISGKENYWMRIRLVDGDYGREVEIQSNGTVKPGAFCPPAIRALRLLYEKKTADRPDCIVHKNNLAAAIIREESFAPFAALPDEYPAIYFCFDKALEGGPTGLFVSVDERFEYPAGFRPRLAWQYYGEGGWAGLDVLDETEGFTKSGIVQVSLPAEMASLALLGKNSCYWIRVLITEDFFGLSAGPDMQKPIFSSYLNLLGRYRKNIISGLDRDGGEIGRPVISKINTESKVPGMSECTGGVEVYNFSLLKDALKKLPPNVLGFYLNTAWATQSRAVRDEITGSGSGQAYQSFTLLNPPVIDADLWVNEASSLSEGEKEGLGKSGVETEEITDEKGYTTAFWVRWSERDDFVDSSAGDRHYLMDRVTGKVQFSEGTHGMIPPRGADNIKVTYSSGGGRKGNIDASAISKLQSPVASIDKVFNPIAAEGGNDAEETDSLIDRSPAVIKNRHRAVALDDFCRIAGEASRDIARVKVLPNFDESGSYRTGWVTVVVVPEGKEANPAPSPALRRKVENYLRGFGPNIASIRVIQPSYIRADVSSELITKEIDAIPVIENEAGKRLSGYLHPLAGGCDGKGWEFGAAPCISDIYDILGNIENVDHVKRVTIALQTAEGGKVAEITDNSDVVRLPPYALIYGGEHRIIARLGG